jgi:hypothetical protein
MYRQFDAGMNEPRPCQGFDPVPVNNMKKAVPINVIGYCTPNGRRTRLRSRPPASCGCQSRFRRDVRFRRVAHGAFLCRSGREKLRRRPASLLAGSGIAGIKFILLCERTFFARAANVVSRYLGYFQRHRQ